MCKPLYVCFCNPPLSLSLCPMSHNLILSLNLSSLTHFAANHIDAYYIISLIVLCILWKTEKMGQKKSSKKANLEPFLVPTALLAFFSFTIVLFIGHNLLTIGHCTFFTPLCKHIEKKKSPSYLSRCCGAVYLWMDISQLLIWTPAGCCHHICCWSCPECPEVRNDYWLMCSEVSKLTLC